MIDIGQRVKLRFNIRAKFSTVQFKLIIIGTLLSMILVKYVLLYFILNW